MRVRVHAPGDPGHGVVRHAELVAELAGVERASESADLVHAHFTDALYGPDVTSAADAFTAWAAGVGPLVVTLHDVPGDDPNPARARRRRTAYARVAAAADAVVVSSEHEAERMRQVADVPVQVIPLPLPPAHRPGPRPSWADRPTLVVLGFVYPGKGHEEAVELAARCGVPRVVAAGGISPGHEDLVAALSGRVEVVVTGPLSDADLAAAVRAATVPFVGNPGVSASGSLLTWLAHGRRPVVMDGGYAAEVGRLTGAFTPASDAELPRAVEGALCRPALTRLPAPLDWPDVGAAHRELYRAVSVSAAPRAGLPC
jgi:glycosyltransferase involved in cell wall biosynthesis